MRTVELVDKKEDLIKMQMKTISKLQDIINLQKFDLAEERRKNKDLLKINLKGKKRIATIKQEIRAYMQDNNVSHLKKCLLSVRGELESEQD